MRNPPAAAGPAPDLAARAPETLPHPGFGFDVLHRAVDSAARVGRLTTPHGALDTPNFIFCGTKAALKAVTVGQAREADADIILANTYHLMIQPGADTVAALGGLHALTRWDGPMLTDSGGFQIFSMGHGGVAQEVKGSGGRKRETSLLRITEEGAAFRSYLDGRTLFLSPEGAMDIQRKLGADLVVQFDECTPFHVDRGYTERALRMSQRWADRSLARFARDEATSANGLPQAFYGIISGGVYRDLREDSCAFAAGRPYFGTAVGDCLGGDKEQMYEVVSYCTPHLPAGRPVHLLGIGNFRDILIGVTLGMDTFDCVHPTRVARHGWALKKGAKGERVNLRNARFREERGPIDATCPCPTCREYPAGYLHHAIKAGEMVGMTLISIHNMATMTRLMRDIRQGIATATLPQVSKDWLGE